MRVSLLNVDTKEIRPPEPEYPVHAPLATAHLGAILRERGYDVTLLDERVFSREELVSAIRDSDCLGITALTPSAPYVIEWARFARGLGKWVLIGGPHATLEPRYYLERDVCDAVGVGEGDETLPELIDCLDGGGDLASIRGIGFRRGDEIVLTPPRPVPLDLDALPFAAFDLLPMERYFRANPKEKVFHLAASRGCPRHCNFCRTVLIGENFRRRSPEKVVDEIESLYRRHGRLTVLFADPLFVSSKRWISDFCRDVLDRHLDIRWAANARVDSVDLDTLRLMKRAGAERVYYGFESGSQRILDSLEKGTRVEQIVRAGRATRAAGIWFKASLMVGTPGETAEDVEMTRKMLRRAMPDAIRVHRFVPLAETRIFQHVKDRMEEGFQESNYVYGAPRYRHDHFSHDEIEAIQHEVYYGYHRWRYSRRRRALEKLRKLSWYARNPSYLPGRLKATLAKLRPGGVAESSVLPRARRSPLTASGLEEHHG